MPPPPIPPPPGQAIAWAYPTAIQGYDGGTLIYPPGFPDEFSFGYDPDNIQIMFSTRWKSGFSHDFHYKIVWSNFQIAGSLPPNSGAIRAIRPVVVCSLTGIPLGFQTCAFSSISNAGITLFTYTSSNVPPTFESTAFSSSDSLGTTDADLASVISAHANDSSASGIGSYTINNTFMAVAVYYDAPIMPIGHAANCNAYDPISVADGATTPPGNGTLISL